MSYITILNISHSHHKIEIHCSPLKSWTLLTENPKNQDLTALELNEPIRVMLES